MQLPGTESPQVQNEVAVSSFEKTDSFFSRQENRIFAILFSLLVAAFGLVYILLPQNLFADDSYFYLQVAWNFARGKGSTFNNLMPTNGYHPLWMLVCAAVFKVFPQRPTAIHAVAAVGVLLDVLMLVAVRKLLQLTARDLWPIAFVLLIPFSFLTQLGTEGALSGFFLALTVLFGYRLLLTPNGPRAFLFHLAASLAVLSRLDNIFIVAFLWLSLTAVLAKRHLRLQIITLPLYVVLWGGYLASNHVYFGTWQPISGMLKANSPVDHRIGSNLPTIAIASFTLLLIGFVGLLWTKRDLFFRAIEVPYLLGVVCHGLYITFRMSSETRWSWYYTSWVLLAAIMTTRLLAVLLPHLFPARRALARPLATLGVVILVLLWVRGSYFHTIKLEDRRLSPEFMRIVYQQAGIHTALAYDQPGKLAYSSDVQIIPLDGLMGNLQFQSDLDRMGIERYVATHRIDGFIGPPAPLSQSDYENMCTKVFLSSVEFKCSARPSQDHTYNINAVDVYSRVPAAFAGTLPLPDSQLIWTSRNYVSVWRLRP